MTIAHLWCDGHSTSISTYGLCGNLRCVGLLGNSQACLAISSAVLGMLRNILGMLGNVLGMPFRKVYGSLVVHYSLGFTAYKATSGGISLRRGTPRTLQKHAEVGRGRCQACLGRCKACLHILGSYIYIYIYIYFFFPSIHFFHLKVHKKSQ